MAPYTCNIKTMFGKIQKIVSFATIIIFIVTSIRVPVYAQTTINQMPYMPKPGVIIHVSPEFNPAHLVGVTIHPDNALQFDFLINRGEKFLSEVQKKEEYNKLVKYFLASLTIPDDDQWVTY